MKLSEPTVVYNSAQLQQLRTRLMETINGENRVVKLQQCIELLQNDDEASILLEQDFWECISEATRRLAVDSALSDYKSGQCLNQDEMNAWLKERMGWK